MPTPIKPRDLRLRDVVSMTPEPGPFSAAVVVCLRDARVKLFRPYATTSDFDYTGGVIPYIGVETWTIDFADTRPVYLLERREEQA